MKTNVRAALPALAVIGVIEIPAKMEVWFSSRNVQKAMVKMRPRYLARSPVNILSAMKFTISCLF